MKEQTGMQLIRVGAYTACGTLLVYGAVALALSLARSRAAATAKADDCGCGCGGAK